MERMGRGAVRAVCALFGGRWIWGLTPASTAARTIPADVRVRAMEFFDGSTFSSAAFVQDRDRASLEVSPKMIGRSNF
jgi:hypothetical protein